MADSDKTLELLIKLGVVGKEDAQAANDLLKETADSTKNLAGSTDEAATSTRLFSGEGREAHRIIGEINRILPGTGSLFREDFNPTALGAVGVLVGLLYEAKNALDEYNKSLDEAGADAMQPAIDAVYSLRDAWDDALKKIGEYKAAVADAGQGKDPIDDQINQEKIATDAKLDGIKKVIEELGKEEVARLRAEKASPAAIQAAEEQTKAQLDSVEARKSAGDADRLNEEYNYRNTPGYQDDLDQTAEDAARNAAVADKAAAKNDADLKAARDKLNPETAAGAKFQKEQDEAGAVLNAGREAAAKHPTEGYDTTEAQAKVDKLAAERANLLKQQQQAEDKIEPLAREKAEREAAAKNAAEAGEKNARRRHELPGLIDSQSKANVLKNPGGVIEEGTKAEALALQGHKLTEQQANALAAVKTLLEANGGHMQNFVAIAQAAYAHNAGLQETVEDLKRKFAALAASHANSRNSWSG